MIKTRFTFFLLFFSGNITAPLDGNGKYRNGVRCTWDIETQMGFKININFYGRFDIEQSDNCDSDYVMVRHFCKSMHNFE